MRRTCLQSGRNVAAGCATQTAPAPWICSRCKIAIYMALRHCACELPSVNHPPCSSSWHQLAAASCRFCFETSLKALYWSVLIYRHAEVGL